ncbi:MAG: hypothetical protein H7257_13950, partial [Taibaiella sp.]|nr:hypothetical protein [Taibaiella sp.]
MEGGMAVASLAVSRKPYRNSLVYYNSAQPREQKSATWLSVANHHVLGRFDMGYGVYGGTHF